MEHLNQYIKEIIDWQPITSMFGTLSPKYTDFVEKHGAHGVYQVALKKDSPTELISDKIGYVGKSHNIMSRAYAIKINRHNCRTYINANSIDIKDVVIRFLMTEPNKEHDLESAIHAINQEKYGYRFIWRQASAGKDGTMSRIIEALDKIEDLDELKQLSMYIDERAQNIFLQNWKNEE